MLDTIKRFFSKFSSKNADIDNQQLPPEGFGQISAYSGSSYQTVYNDGSKFEHGISNSGSGNAFFQAPILQNARTAYSETLQARAIVDRFADSVVDTGLRLEPVPKADILGITQEEAETWSEDVAQRFDNWFKSKKCMRAEDMTGYQSQHLVGIYQHRDNDYFVRLHYSNNKNLQNPLQISFIDPMQIQGCSITDTYGNTTKQIDGITRDLGGKELAYSVLVLGKDGYKTVTIPAIGPRSGRRFMLHGFRSEYFGQGRGISRLGHALQDFSNITDFKESHILKAISQSQTSLYVKPSKDNPASDPYETMSGSFRNSISDGMYRAADRDPDTGELSHVEYTDLPEATFRRPGSAGVFMLQGGEDLKPFDMTAPAESYSQFVDSFTSYLSASTGMPLEVMLMKFGSSYSASRAALIMFWRIAEIWRAEMSADYLDPVYEAWLSEEIAAGRVRAPGWSDPRMRAAWLNSNWGGAPMPNIDPQKTATADEKYVRMSAQHLDTVAKNYNGSSGKLNRAKLKKQYEEIIVPPWEKKESANG